MVGYCGGRENKGGLPIMKHNPFSFCRSSQHGAEYLCPSSLRFSCPLFVFTFGCHHVLAWAAADVNKEVLTMELWRKLIHVGQQAGLLDITALPDMKERDPNNLFPPTQKSSFSSSPSSSSSSSSLSSSSSSFSSLSNSSSSSALDQRESGDQGEAPLEWALTFPMRQARTVPSVVKKLMKQFKAALGQHGKPSLPGRARFGGVYVVM